MTVEDKATEITRRYYDRIASLYDLVLGLVERSGDSKWRKLLWRKVEDSRILEIGVGTGANFPYYPGEAEITAVDFSEKMLTRAKAKASKQRVTVHLQQMDVQHLQFEDNTFDTIISSFF
jgi:ubiquinone/menaquinone biosynthesis C-methylase UbiE